MTEFELIARLIPALPGNEAVVTGAGDDCAVLDLGLADRLVLFKTDAVVEGVHFASGAPPEKVGHKALARCLSDLAAMAGTPTAALVTVGLPRDFDPAWVEAAYAGLNALARRWNVAVAGGETTTSPERVFFSVAVLGTVAKERCLRRAGSQPGDALFVTGQLGGALAGRHLDFEPRLAEAQWLAGRFAIHAMIDLSDGLASDLRHLLRPGGLGAELLAPAIPISPAARARARSDPGAKPPLVAALTEGEDFELLFTVAAREAVPLLDAWKQAFPGLALTCIGRITATAGVTIRDRDRVRPLSEHGYVHFA